jgi:hypothetical protein
MGRVKVDSHSVIGPWPPSPGKAVCVLLARPKSHTLRSQFAFKSRLEGFKSR